MSDASVLVASNRGPVSFTLADDGTTTMRRGGGGLVSGLSAVAAPSRTGGSDVIWACAALTDADRQTARRAPGGRLDLAGHDTGGAAVRMLDIPPSVFHRAYNAVANSTLWFVHHLLYDTPIKPSFDARSRREWESYRTYNQAFADALADDAAPGAKVAVQDYHLTLTPKMLRERRPDLRIAHFSHTPWAPPDYFRMLPDDIGREVLEGVLGADHAGFLSERWADAFVRCCEAFLGARIERATGPATDAAAGAGTGPAADAAAGPATSVGADGCTVEYRGRRTRVGVHALGVDAPALARRAGQPDVEGREAALREIVGDRRLVVRIDRTELSKNIVRGLAAYREMLRTYPEWHGRVVHLAFAYPSRHDLPEYREYTAAVQRIAKEIEDEFGTEHWDPLILQVNDDYPRSLAAYRLADVLLVNPIRDGMNLVAKEGPILSEHGCALVLSREAGAAAELGEEAVLVNPYDVSGTAYALHRALRMPADERRLRCRRLATVASALPPQQWFADQLAALE